MVIPGRGPRDESGAAVPLVVALVGLVVVVGIVATAVTSVVATHRTAQAAADLAALAGARGAQDGTDPCAAATRIARANGAELVGCRVRQFEVRVEVVALTRPLPGGERTVRARARAGPVSLLRG